MQHKFSLLHETGTMDNPVHLSSNSHFILYNEIFLCDWGTISLTQRVKRPWRFVFKNQL